MHIATPGQPLGVSRAGQVASRLSMSANRCIAFRVLAKVSAPSATPTLGRVAPTPKIPMSRALMPLAAGPPTLQDLCAPRLHDLPLAPRSFRQPAPCA